jgi:predicted metal-dependent HD superfamily phosphohydrolase
VDAAILDELRRRYAEPHRHLHVWSHVAGLLAQAEDIAAAIADRPAFILAVLFHRAVFDRRLPDSGPRSVALMCDLAGRATPPTRLLRAEALVMAIAKQEVPETPDVSLRGDAALLLDMDRAPLGAEPAAFDAHEAAHRAEYPHLKDDAYAAGRAAELRMLAWRDRIYHTDRYYLAQERRARRNIDKLIARLGE